MKILQINDYSGAVGGAEAYMHGLGRLLEARGHELLELTGPTGPTAWSLVSRWFNPYYYHLTARTVRAFRPDIVHLHSCSRHLSPAVALAVHRARVPLVMTVHDAHVVCPKTWMIYADGEPCPHGFGYRCLISNCHTNRMGAAATPYHALKITKVGLHRAMLRACVDTFISPSRWLAQWIRQSLEATTVTYLPNFAEPVGAGAVPRTKHSSRLLFVGRLVPEKAPDTALAALAHLPERVRLDVVGDGPERAVLKRQSKNLGVDDRVVFHGTVEPQDVQGFYQGAAALVMPSRWMENSPLVMFEALAAGLPILGSSHGGVGELIREGETGFTFAHDDAVGLAEKSRRLLDDKVLWADMSRRTKEWSEAEFSPSRHIDRLIKTYDHAVGKSASADGKGLN